MFCKNCGINMGEVENEYCEKCEAEIKTTTVQTENAEVVKEVNTTQSTSENTNNVAGKVGKSKILAGIFGIAFGGLGVHNFYLGYNGKGIAQLLITVLSCFMFTPISSIWGLVEGILILTGEISKDADGNPLVD